MIAPQITHWAKHFGIDADLIAAVVQAEGGLDRIVRAVQCSVPSVATVDEALMITCRSAVHALSDYIRAHEPDAFVLAWRDRWAPLRATNDPQGLNANWARNVTRAWLAPPKADG